MEVLKDWLDWHKQYEDESSALYRRLDVVQRELSRELIDRAGESTKVLSVCAGQGDDVLGVVASTRNLGRVETWLVELDSRNAEIARKRIAGGGHADIEVVHGDAGILSIYEGFVPADVVLVCGVFGNIPERDIYITIDALPQLVARGGIVIWTRSRRQPDITPKIRQYFVDHQFSEESFTAPDGDLWTVGVERFVGRPRSLQLSSRMFTFTDD